MLDLIDLFVGLFRGIGRLGGWISGDRGYRTRSGALGSGRSGERRGRPTMPTEDALRGQVPAVATGATGSAATPPPAGWYPDPTGDGGHRWWDGARWTPRVTDR